MSKDPTTMMSTLPYYFSNLKTPEQVVQLLYDYITVDGAFVLRNSNSAKGYTLSVVHGKGVKHIKVRGHHGSYYLSNQKFGTMSELIDYYSANDVPNVEKVISVRLTHPITEDSSLVEEARHVSVPSEQASSPIGLPPRGEPRPRPPAPPPTSPLPTSPPPQPHCHSLYSSTYTEPRPLNENLTELLIDQLKENEKCECGLYIQDAILPQGWAVHLTGTMDGQGNPRIFFVSPEQQSSWSLPDHIKALLKPHHREFISKYKIL